MSTAAKPVVFSGAQPTSDSLHLGNALGAVNVTLEEFELSAGFYDGGTSVRFEL